jgi:hypothetical protein
MVDNTTVVDKIIVGYSPGDFFYSTVENELDADICKTYQLDPSWTEKCNEANFADNKADCINVELCKNSKNVQTLYDRNRRKSENHERNLNTLSIYRTEYITMWNLGIAIVGLLISIYYLFSSSGAVKMASDLAEKVSSRFSEMTGSQGQTGVLEGGPGAGPGRGRVGAMETGEEGEGEGEGEGEERERPATEAKGGRKSRRK